MPVSAVTSVEARMAVVLRRLERAEGTLASLREVGPDGGCLAGVFFWLGGSS
jgi:hypothetical protein